MLLLGFTSCNTTYISAIAIILELGNAIAPRLRSVFGLVGTSLVFTLTQIIGKGIGLIGKGIIQGLGNSIKEPKSNNSKRKI